MADPTYIPSRSYAPTVGVAPEHPYVPFDPNGGTAPMTPPSGAVPHTVSPGISGAILDAVKALAQAFAPKGITDRGKVVKQAIDQGEGAPDSLGNQFPN